MPLKKYTCQTGRQMSRFNSASKRFAPITPSPADMINVLRANSNKRLKWLRVGFTEGMREGICPRCPAVLACLCHLVYSINRCEKCHTVFVHFEAEDAITKMDFMFLPENWPCRVLNNDEPSAEVMGCPTCLNWTEDSLI